MVLSLQFTNIFLLRPFFRILIMCALLFHFTIGICIWIMSILYFNDTFTWGLGIKLGGHFVTQPRPDPDDRWWNSMVSFLHQHDRFPLKHFIYWYHFSWVHHKAHLLEHIHCHLPLAPSKHLCWSIVSNLHDLPHKLVPLALSTSMAISSFPGNHSLAWFRRLTTFLSSS